MKTLTAKTCERCESKFTAKTVNQKYCSLACRKGTKTPPEPEYMLMDASNHLLSLGPSALSCGVIETEEGPRLIVTVRTTSATVTIALTDREAGRWLAEFTSHVSAVRDVAANQA